MYPPPHAYAPVPAPAPRPPRRWWQHPALIITALVLLPPVGIALAWTSQWERTQKILATVLSGIWFLIPLLSDPPKEAEGKGKAQTTAAASASPTPSTSPSPSPAQTAAPTPSAEPLMPSAVGWPYAQAEKTVEELIDGELKALSAYADVALPADHGTWLVCFQDIAAGTGLAPQSAAPAVHLVAPGTNCPAAPGTDLRPKPAAPTTAPTTAPAPDEDETGGSGGGGGNVSYKNCTAVKAAGAAPIRRGDPGYARHLDRDGDGVGCES
ncbi:excalibur calcium-binding domain-containing protein [Streptomyces sp. NPDC059979]|uniref:excalibur calcium-binding domain-containing protein n=1 Tax=Streptomyces sp. NPDC059979 TaxID=3347021 RepID=UPI003685D0F6